MAEPYTCTIGTTWTQVSVGGGTVGPNRGEGVLYWAVHTSQPPVTLAGIEFVPTVAGNAAPVSFGNPEAGEGIWLRADKQWLVTVQPDTRPNPLPAV